MTDQETGILATRLDHVEERMREVREDVKDIGRRTSDSYQAIQETREAVIAIRTTCQARAEVQASCSPQTATRTALAAPVAAPNGTISKGKAVGLSALVLALLAAYNELASGVLALVRDIVSSGGK